MRLPNIKICSLILSATFLSACSNHEIPLDSDMSNAVTTVATTTIGDSATSTSTNTTTTAVTTVTSTPQEGSVTTAIATTTTEATTTTNNDETFGYTVNEVTSIAKDLYSKACKKYRSVLVDGAYSIDYTSYVTNQYGARYYHVNDPNCPTTETVLEDWHTVFTNAYDDLINTNYVMYDGSVYAYVAIQQENTNYDSTTLVYYYPTGDYELTFKATSHYSSGDKVAKFSITYSPDTQEWRVSKFTMPY